MRQNFCTNRKMSNKPKKVIFTSSQFKLMKTLLKLDESMSESQRLNKVKGRGYDEVADMLTNFVDVIEFNDDESVYHLLNYKSYSINLEPYWKQFRGIIVKDYKKIVCGSAGSTPIITVDQPLESYMETDRKGRKIITLTETLENGKKVDHRLPFNDSSVTIRPAFQGTVIRVWLSNGNLFRSSLRKPTIDRATWIQPESDGIDIGMTFSQKFDTLCGFGKDQFFKPGVRNSPFCHIFLMCTPQVTTYSRIDCGRGYLIYLETKECYDPIPNDPNEEEKSFFLSRIPKEELSEEEVTYGIKRQMDRYVFPLAQTTSEGILARFIPPPTTEAYLATDSAVYKTAATMTLKEANKFLIQGVDTNLQKKEIKELQEKYPLQLPGEALYCSFLVHGMIKTFIINPACVNYKIAIIGDVNNRKNQIFKLRNFAMIEPKKPSRSGFFGIEADLDNCNFEDICHTLTGPKGDIYYYGIRSNIYESESKELPHPPEEDDYTILRAVAGTTGYFLDDIKNIPKTKKVDERNTYTNTRWFIAAYYYCLCLPPKKRKAGWESFRDIYYNYVDVVDFICTNYDDILDDDSLLSKSYVFDFAKIVKKPGYLRLKQIVETAKTTEYTKKNKSKQEVTLDPESNYIGKKSRLAGDVSYISAASVSSFDIVANIRNILRNEESTSLYRIIKIIKDHIIKNTQLEALAMHT